MKLSETEFVVKVNEAIQDPSTTNYLLESFATNIMRAHTSTIQPS